MKKMMACGLILLVLSSVFVASTYSKDANLDLFILESKVLSSSDLAKKLVRFHVIANSDTEVDQEVKLKVKDDVLEYMIPKLEVSTSKEETIKIISENNEEIQHIAQETLHTYNMDNDVSVELETTFFPTKYYKDFSLPAGDYLALRVIIGSGQGKNWWCVLFPPLCLIDVKTETPIKEKKNNILQEKEIVEDYDNIKEPRDKAITKAETISPPNSLSEEEIEEVVGPEENIKKSVKDKKTSKKEKQEKIEDQYNKEDSRQISLTKKSNRLSSDKKSFEVSSLNHNNPKIRWKALELLGFYN